MQNIQKNEEEKKCKERRFLVEDVVCAAQANMMILFEEKTVRIIQFAIFFLVQITEYIPIVSSFSLNVKHN